MRTELRLSGSGGQGVITAAIILAEAAVMEKKQAVQSQSYGPEARGGASKSEVILSDESIFHPHVEAPDFVLAMTQEAADKYYGDLSEDGMLVIDSMLVPKVPAFRNVVSLPITKLAIEEVGRSLYANVVALGAIVYLTGLVSFDAAEKALINRVPAATVAENKHALRVGYEAAMEAMGEELFIAA